MGIFSKLANALKKTKKALSDAIGSLFSKNKIGDEFYDGLEEILISSDISVNTAADVVEELRAEVKAEKIRDKEFVVACLKDILQDKLEEAPLPEIEYPAVIMLVGVNGVGKTTTVGKLASYFLRKGKTVTVAAAAQFRDAASDQLSVWA
ncbi:MAG: signal recognition particle receptor subunit alpha, partial [Clostridia bacterium]|nr:signal recognition particle receptor subunit alpha [Clostridia bacterium]